MLNVRQITIIILLLMVFASFGLAQAKFTNEMKKIIEENTPKALPQSPIATKPKSDATDENLKGKVKNIVEETQSFSEFNALKKRKFSIITDFNKNSNYLKRIYFSSNNPTFIIVYGYIDGERVSNSKAFYGFRKTPQISIVNKNTKPDLRYDLKYEYKYINDKLAEMQIFLNTGEKGMSYIYNYNGNQMENLIYGYDGKLNQKYITVFDDKNYEIEWSKIAIINISFDKDMKYRIKNELFDKQGNWTKRTFSKVEIENGKEIYKPSKREYRTIKYYP